MILTWKAVSKVEKSNKLLSNELTYAAFREAGEVFSRKNISGKDLTDQNNDPTFFTYGVRNIEKAWADLTARFNEKTTMNEVVDILDNYDLKCYLYCAVD